MIVCFFWKLRPKKARFCVALQRRCLAGRALRRQVFIQMELVLTCTQGQINFSTCRPSQGHVVQGVRKPLSCRHNLNKAVALLRESGNLTTISASMSFLLCLYMFHFEPRMFVAFYQGTCGDCGLDPGFEATLFAAMLVFSGFCGGSA